MELIKFVFSSLHLIHLVFSISDITSHKSWNFLDDDICGIVITDRIIGGRTASLGQFPWLAQIGYASRTSKISRRLRFRCGGALINKYYVLTAAHCVVHIPKNQFVEIVRLGEYNTQTTTDCYDNICAEPVQDISPKRITVHGGYNVPPFKNDIALIQLSSPAEYNGWVMPVCLPRGSMLSKNYLGQFAEVAGWGIYNISTGESSTITQSIKIPIQKLEICITVYKTYTQIGPEQMCAGGIAEQDSCGGDSGGPMTKVEAVDGSPRQYVIGIVSFGPKHCGSIIPAIYTNVAVYLRWILDNLQQ